MPVKVKRCVYILFLALATPAFPQTAGMLSFQGLIKDAQGDPVTGSVDLEFRIFDAATGGNLVDMDGDGVVEDVIGQDAKQSLGVSATNGILSTKFGPVSPKAFDGDPRWLEVSVNGSPLSRIEMATAPAAAEQINAHASGASAIQVNEFGSVSVGITGDPGIVKVKGPNGNDNIRLTYNSAGSDLGFISVANELGSTRASLFVASSGEGRARVHGPNGNINVELTANGSNADFGVVRAANSTGETRADLYVSDPSGAGVVRVLGPNGNTNAALTHNGADPNLGAVVVANANGDTRAFMLAHSGGAGRVTTFGANGSDNIRLSANELDPDLGFLAVANADSNTVCEMSIDPTSLAGNLIIRGPNGNENVVISESSTDPNHGRVTVHDSSGVAQAGMEVDAAGNGIVFGHTKSFKIPHPDQPGREIWYACPEGPEAAAYFRGTGQLVNGQATIPCPDHFRAVATSRGMTVTLTPLSAASKGLAVVSKGIDSITVQELGYGVGNYQFDYYVMAVRRGLEDFQVVRITAPDTARQVRDASSHVGLREGEDAVTSYEARDQMVPTRRNAAENDAEGGVTNLDTLPRTVPGSVDTPVVRNSGPANARD